MKIFSPLVLLIVLAVLGFYMFGTNTAKPHSQDKSATQTTKTPATRDPIKTFLSDAPIEKGKDIKSLLSTENLGKTIVATGGVGDIYKGRASFRLLGKDLMTSCEEANPELPWIP